MILSSCTSLFARLITSMSRRHGVCVIITTLLVLVSLPYLRVYVCVCVFIVFPHKLHSQFLNANNFDTKGEGGEETVEIEDGDENTTKVQAKKLSNGINIIANHTFDHVNGGGGDTHPAFDRLDINNSEGAIKSRSMPIIVKPEKDGAGVGINNNNNNNNDNMPKSSTAFNIIAGVERSQEANQHQDEASAITKSILTLFYFI